MHYLKTDLDNFPTDKTAKRMLSRISAMYDKSYVMKWLMQVMGLEYAEMGYYIRTFPLQVFPETATWGLRFLEQRYGLEVDESLSVEERRRRLILARPLNHATTPYILTVKATAAAGVDVLVEESKTTPFVLNVSLDTTDSTPDIEGMMEELKRIKPSHLIFEVHESSTSDMEYRYGIGGARFEERVHVMITPDMSWVYLTDALDEWLTDAAGSALRVREKTGDYAIRRTENVSCSTGAGVLTTIVREHGCTASEYIGHRDTIDVGYGIGHTETIIRR